jgi:hypothetical protein
MVEGCTSCLRARYIIKHGVASMLTRFTGTESRKQFYVDNVNRTYELYKQSLVPFEWLGFVVISSAREYSAYFNEDLLSEVSVDIVPTIADYIYDASHGDLFKTLLSKFDNVDKASKHS